MLLGVITQRVDLVLIACAPALLVTVGAVLYQRPELSIDLVVPSRAVEGDVFDLIVTVKSRAMAPWVHVELELPAGLVPVQGHSQSVASIPARHQATFRFPVKVTQWGVVVPGRVIVTCQDRFGLFRSSSVHNPRPRIAIHPGGRNRRAEIVPRNLRSRVGTHRSRGHGDGSDFAEIRAMRTGDSPKALNWRVSALKQEPWVTVRHPERSGDLVILLDSFADLGPAENRLVQRSVRAAMGLAESNLDQHDRVGVLDVGHHVRWYRPRTGRLHRAKLLDALLQTQVEPRLKPPSIRLFPLHDLDDATTIVMISGLTNEPMSQRPLELRRRGLDVALLEIDASSHIDHTTSKNDLAAARLWSLERAKRRDRLIQNGVTVATWSADQPLELAIAVLAQRHIGPRR